MIKKFILIYFIVTGFAFCQSALARPSLESMDAKLDQLLAGQEAILADLERLRAELGISLTKCADIEFEGVIWGSAARGVDLRRFTNSTLHFIGCIGNGCAVADFFCNFDASNLTLTFGTSSTFVLRALVDPDNAAGDDMSGGLLQCASSSQPDAISNAPDGAFEAVALCRALGYQNGSVEAAGSNNCPEPSALDAEGQFWTSTYQPGGNYGRVYTCSQ